MVKAQGGIMVYATFMQLTSWIYLVAVHSQSVTSLLISFVFPLCCSLTLIISHYLFVSLNSALIPEPGLCPAPAMSLFLESSWSHTSITLFLYVPLCRLTLWRVSCSPCWWLCGFGSTSTPARPVLSSDMWWPLCWASTWLSSALAGESLLCLSHGSFLVITVILYYAPSFLPSFLPNFFLQYHVGEILFLQTVFMSQFHAIVILMVISRFRYLYVKYYVMLCNGRNC